jgi:signal transduction histidine kinase
MLFALLVPDPGGRQAAARDRLADVILIVLALGYGATMTALGDATDPGALLPWPVDVAVGLAAAAVLPLRRRHPLALTAALIPLGAVSVMATGPITVALFSAAVRSRPVPLLLLGVAHVLTGGGYYLGHDDPAFDVWVDLLVRSVVTVAALGWGLFMQAYRRLTAGLRDQAARLRSEQEMREERARLTERARIARETHDVLAHRMSLISLHAGALEVRGQVSPAELEIAAGAIRTSAHEALEELRAVLGVPSGRPEPPQPGLADLGPLVESARTAGMTIDFTSTVPPHGPPVPLGRTVYRIVQEGLTNARKHGTRPAAVVLLAGEAGHALRITITNPFRGTTGAHQHPAGQGLPGIGERVALAGGEVRWTAEDGEFRLEASLPWPG